MYNAAMKTDETNDAMNDSREWGDGGGFSTFLFSSSSSTQHHLGLCAVIRYSYVKTDYYRVVHHIFSG